MPEGLVFVLAWLLPMLLLGALLVGLWVLRLHLASDVARVGQVQAFFLMLVPYALGTMPITLFFYWALGAWT